VTAEAVAVFDPRRAGALFVQYHNHVPLARRLAREFDVSWGGPATVDALEKELSGRNAKKVGVIGPLAAGKQQRLARKFTLVNLNDAYTLLRMVKSPEELDWVRVGAWLSDLAVESLVEEAKAGVDERGLWRICENAYVGQGGTTWIHYFGATQMAEDARILTLRRKEQERIARGDALFCRSVHNSGNTRAVLRSCGAVQNRIRCHPPPRPRPPSRDARRSPGGRAGCCVGRRRGIIRRRASPPATIWCTDLSAAICRRCSFSKPTCRPVPDCTPGRHGDHAAAERGDTTPRQCTNGELVTVTETGHERLHRAPMEFFRLN
jgi:hypothetical protein